MSPIAQALAKAKEHTPAPFAVPGEHGHIAKPVAAPPIKSTQRTWVILLSFAVVFGGLSLWLSGRYKLEPDAGNAGVSSTPDGSDAMTGTAAAATDTSSPDPVNSGPVANPEVQEAINALVLSAVMPGQPPRIMLQGRVVAGGQPIDGTLLVFIGIKGDRLIFTDADGAVYTRRY
jgi:hypothetical protein